MWWRVLISSVPREEGSDAHCQEASASGVSKLTPAGNPSEEQNNAIDGATASKARRRPGSRRSTPHQLRPNARQRRAMMAGQLIDASHPASKQLIEAVKNQQLEEVEKLYASKEFTVNANIVDEDDPYQRTPLLYTCEHPNVEIARVLVMQEQYPANINTSDYRGRTPIWWAAKFGDVELAKIILGEPTQMCEVNTIDPDSGCTPLHRAILSNSAEICRLLVQCGADVNVTRIRLRGSGDKRESPLIQAVLMDNLEICDLLVNSLCDKEATTEDGFTALHYACAYRRYDICDLLLANRVKKHAQTPHGVTPMVIAIAQRNAHLCKKLIEFGYNLNKRFQWDETPLEMAIKYHSEDCALTLVHWGCSLKQAESGIPSYFTQSVYEGQVNLCKLMVDIEPGFLNESWVRGGYVPLAFYKRPQLGEWLQAEAASPRTLLNLTRSHIYKYLGKYPCSKIDQLPLPERLKAFVGMMDYFPLAMYEQKTIRADECPYDCLASCMKERCPVLDFSSSESDGDDA